MSSFSRGFQWFLCLFRFVRQCPIFSLNIFFLCATWCKYFHLYFFNPQLIWQPFPRYFFFILWYSISNLFWSFIFVFVLKFDFTFYLFACLSIWFCFFLIPTHFWPTFVSYFSQIAIACIPTIGLPFSLCSKFAFFVCKTKAAFA